MSFCVNCGVELAKTEKSCPLCMVEVKNPLAPFASEQMPLYADVPVAGVRRYRDLALPFCLLMLIPMSLCLVIDLLTTGNLSWSRYVALSLLLLAIFTLPPLFMERINIMLCIVLDWTGTVGFLFVLDRMTPGNWYMAVAMPFAVVAGIAAILLAAFFVYLSASRWVRGAASLIVTALLAVAADLLVKRFTEAERPIGWSLFVVAPCIVLAAVALVINRNAVLKERVKQRFFV